MAARQGLRRDKSKARDPRALTSGTYQLIAPYSDKVVAGDRNQGYGLILDQVEDQVLVVHLPEVLNG
jgi:hypothetical protein